MASDDFFDQFGRAAAEYERRFNEPPPLAAMPDDPEEALELIREALDAGEPYEPEVPPEAEI